MKYPLLLSLCVVLQQAAQAQTTTEKPVAHPTPLPPLPESALQSTATVTAVPGATAGQRFQYQLLKIQNGEVAFLAPMWRNITRLDPEVVQNGKRSQVVAGSLEAKVMQTLNELAGEGWELLEVYNVSRPVSAHQQVETSLRFSDPNRPIYTGNTSVVSYTETRYLLRRVLVTSGR